METTGQVRGDELEERLIDFAVRIVKLTGALPKTSAGNHMAGQILRSGTSPAPNYGEARGAESPADFLHKIRVVLKELNETQIWLKIIKKSNLVAPDKMESLLNESNQLCRIFIASVKTARTRLSSKSTQSKAVTHRTAAPSIENGK